jgi:murein DD-endopeptidase MepM/ murein hydrolase activator NlpD
MSRFKWLTGVSIAISLSLPMDTGANGLIRDETQQVIDSSVISSPHPTPEFSNSTLQSRPVQMDIGQAVSDEPTCPAPVLSRVIDHTVVAGETLEAIAQQYNLIPATLLGFNPSLQGGQLPIGSRVAVPPYNGIRISVQPGTTWQTLAERYGVRADVLFEINGCQPPGEVAFIPGVNWSPMPSSSNTPSGAPTRSVRLSGYPLPSVAEVLQDYGWQLQPTANEVVFNSGVSLAVSVGTSVIAVESGIVAFAGEQSDYGKLVVVNHDFGLQTRYAYLSEVNVVAGQQVDVGDVLGKSGQIDASAPGILLFEVRSNSELGWIAQNPADYVNNMRRFER